MWHPARSAARAVGSILLFGSAVATAAIWPDEREVWTRVDSSHFRVYTNSGQRHAEEAARDLEALREAVRVILQPGGVSSHDHTTIFIFRNPRSFEPYRDEIIGHRNTAAAGLFVSGDYGNYIAAATGRRNHSSVIFHEYLHDFLSTYVPEAPLWFNEGLGDFFSTFRHDGNLAIVGLPVETHLRKLAVNELKPMESLLMMTPSSDEYRDGSRTSVFYAQSWALTHYFLAGGGDRSVLQRYLQGRTSSASLADEWRLLETTPEALETSLRAYLAAKAFNYFRVPLSGEVAEIELQSERVGRDEILFELGNLLYSSGDEKTPQVMAHYREALRINPGHAGAHGRLGAILHLQGLEHEAAMHLAAATESETTDYLPHLLQGERLLDGIESGTITFDGAEPPPDGVIRARELFLRSIELKGDEVRSWAGLGATYLYESGEDVGPGIQALERCLQIEPRRIDALVHLIVLNLKAGQRERAEALFDERLSRLGDEERNHTAERALAAWDVDQAARLAAAGRLDEARAMLERAISTVSEPELVSQLQRDLLQIESALESNRLISLYNEAVRAANELDYARAVEILDQIERQTRDRALLEDVARLRRTVEGFIEANNRVGGAR